MTTLKVFFGTAGLAIALAVVAQGYAADQPPPQPADGGASGRGISGVTDGDGNPVDLAPSAAKPNAAVTGAGKDAATVLRGQAWWPYGEPMPPYSRTGKRVEELTEDEIVVNATATIDVRDEAATVGKAPRDLVLRAGAQRAEREGYYLVKIDGFTRTQEQIDALTRAGAVLGEYLNVNTYLAKIPSASYAGVKALPFVSYVGDYHPAYKISPRLGLEEVPAREAFDEVTGRPQPWLLEVVLHEGASVDEVLNALAGLRIFPRDTEVVSSDAMNVILVRAAPDAVPGIALIPGVKWIAEKSYPRLWASASNPATIPMILQNDGVYTTTTATGWKLWNAGIDGSATGQIVTMMDSGLNTKMEHFAQNTASAGTIGAAHRKVVGYDNYGGDLCVLDNNGIDGGHGAKTSQHAVGSISNMATNPDTLHLPNVHYDNGIARGAKLYFQDIGTSAGTLSVPTNLGPSITAAIGKGSYVQNHSWGAPNNLYDTQASNLDAALFSNPNMVVTVSAGNRGAGGGGTLGSPATAKNAICVGGNDVAHRDNLFIDCGWDGTAACSSTSDLGSSRGPVSGVGRTKPDIMAYIWASTPVGGEQMAFDAPTAMCQSDATKTVYWNYVNVGNEGGTSFSAPQVAGLAALVRDYFLQGFYPTGTPTPADVMTPSGSLVKAMILASGEDMAATAYPQTSVAIGKRYSSDVGYGRANLPAVLHIGASAPFLTVKNDAALGQAATNTLNFTINGNAIPLRVMMVYYDAAGDALQKDADLRVTIGASTYWGNNFSGGWSTTATSTRDRTNNTEGVFLDAAHGLPASGTIQVDVLGFNNPGGMTYSLVVVGDVADRAVPAVSMDKGEYNCGGTVEITVNDAAASSPVSVTLVSKNAGGTPIDTKVVGCSGSGGVFTGTIAIGSGIAVADGGTLTASYAGAARSAVADVNCQAAVTDSGFRVDGGCDNAAAGTDKIYGPLTNSGRNEYYNKYMDAGEYNSYTFRFRNATGADLTDVNVSLSFSGAGAAKMATLNGPLHVGRVPKDGQAGAVFQVYTDPTAVGLTTVNMDFDVTSPADGFTASKRLTQTQLLQTNDLIARFSQCATFNTALSPFAESTPVTLRSTSAVQNTWRWSGSAASPTTVGSELRTDGGCGSATPNAAAMVGNSGTVNNYANNADSFLYTNFQPTLRGNGPNGQPYRYVWKWHSFYHASEAGQNTSGVWGAFYNDQWNASAAPTGNDLAAFPLHLASPYYYQSVFDYPSGGTGTWNWETSNTGIPDDPHYTASTGGAPNQLFIVFDDATTGPATSSSWFAYGHEHADIYFFSNPPTHGTHRDIALDNDRLVYDEYYAEAQSGASCGAGGQVGQVAFDQAIYAGCPRGTAVISVVDANGVSGLQATVTSPGTGDSEVVTLTGSAPYFSGTIALSVNSGVGANSGVLFVLPSETLSVSYTDTSPAGTSTATATTACAGGAVTYVSRAQVSDNGDNDGFADNGETVTMDITIQNDTAAALTNAKVTIYPASSNVDCVIDRQALYGTVLPGAAATNPPGDRFTFHVSSSVACSDPLHPPTARFIVIISGGGVDAPAALQSFVVSLDLDPTASGGAYNYTQDFGSDPGWTTAVTPDDDANPACGSYTNSFHWCAACGNGGAGYGAWVGNSPFGTAAQNYPPMDSSTLYSPQFVANGTVDLQFSVAYRTENAFDGAVVQYQLDSGGWSYLAFTTPAQPTTTLGEYCSPLAPGVAAWTGSGVGWTATSTASVPAAAGQKIQFRWRLGSDSSVVGSSYGGYGVDDVSITNLKQTEVCEATRNPSLPACPFCAISPDGTVCDDGNACTSGDACQGGACAGAPITVPGEAQNLGASANKTTYTWSALANATRYDVVRGSLSAFPVGPGGSDEVCFDNLATASVTDSATPAVGAGFWYLSRGENTCAGNGSYGTQSNGSPRVSITCP